MTFATPFFPGPIDYDLYLKALEKQGQCDGHDLLVITQRQHEDEATEFATKAGRLFDRRSVKVIDAVERGGNVGLANALFKAALYEYRSKGKPTNIENETPMLYADPAWYPNRKGWLNAVQSEFFAKGMPKVMCRTSANSRGEPITKGPVVIAKEHAIHAPLVPSLPHNVHWREYLRYELANAATVADTISVAGKKTVFKFQRK